MSRQTEQFGADGLRKCSRCGIRKGRDQFGNYASSIIGVQGQCKPCMIEKHAKYRIKPPKPIVKSDDSIEDMASMGWAERFDKMNA